jgi:uncharacterized protein
VVAILCSQFFHKDVSERTVNQTNSNHIALNAPPVLGDPQAFNDMRARGQVLNQTGALNFLLLLAFAFYAPSTLIWMKIIPFEYRFFAFFSVLAGFSLYCLRRRYTLYELGFRTDNLQGSLIWNLFFCLIGAVGLYATYKAGIQKPNAPIHPPSLYVFYIFFLGPIQEVVFRGILFAEMKRIGIADQRWMILVSTLSFSFLHIIYNHPPLLIITLVSGLTWGIIFAKRPNIWGVSLSHSLLGALAMFLGVI